ncbi:MAG: lipid A biosynthesis acyltransferase [Candidatus Thioglobus sp.]|nr:lipid A biosynthesis acyltransferase [Candidatus Thioglobus sp.]
MKNTNFYHPKFIPTWFLIVFMRFGTKLPFRLQVFIGKGIGSFLYLIFRRFRRIAFINIKLCFTDKNPAEIKLLVRQHFQAIGVAIFEIGDAYFAADAKIRKNLTIKNQHFLTNALAKKQGVILLAAHFMPLILGSRALLLEQATANIYRPQNNKLFDAIMCKTFTEHGANLIKTKDTRSMVRALKNATAMWYAPDQDFGANSVFAPFFNIQTATTKATARLAKTAKTVVICYSFIRTKNGYTMDFSPPLKDYPSADEVADAARTNQILQDQISKNPEQYLWIHRRFKTRPAGEKSFY